MTRFKNWVMGILLRKYVLGYLVIVWDYADGYKSQIQFTLGCGIIAAGFFDFIPLEKSWAIAGIVGGSTFATFMEKLRKHEGLLLKAQDAVDEHRAKKAAQT